MECVQSPVVRRYPVGASLTQLQSISYELLMEVVPWTDTLPQPYAVLIRQPKRVLARPSAKPGI